MLTYEQYSALSDFYNYYKTNKTSLAKATLALKEKYGRNILSLLANKSLLLLTTRSVELTDKGVQAARKTIRKNGVLTFFCRELLGMTQKESENFVKAIFFAVDDYILERFCTLLGHPAKGFIEGECCKRTKQETSEEVIPLSLLPINTPATIVYTKTLLDVTMQKLFSMNLYPGKTIKIRQLYPTYIIHTDNEEIAIENEVAKNIYVKK